MGTEDPAATSTSSLSPKSTSLSSWPRSMVTKPRGLFEGFLFRRLLFFLFFFFFSMRFVLRCFLFLRFGMLLESFSKSLTLSSSIFNSLLALFVIFSSSKLISVLSNMGSLGSAKDLYIKSILIFPI